MRTLFDDDHQAFRESFAAWLSKEVSPHYRGLGAAGDDAARGVLVGRQVRLPRHGDPRAVRRWRHPRLPVQRGDRRGARRGPASAGRGSGSRSTTTSARPYFIEYCNEEQAQRWMPGIASGELITAIAMTEPGTGSDLASIDHHGGARRRRVRAQRFEDVHHQRHQQRPRHRRRQDRSRRSATPACRCSWSSGACPASSAVATSRRSACTARTPPSCSSTTAACRWPTCSATRARAFKYLTSNLAQERLSIADQRCRRRLVPRSSGRSTT